MLCGVSDDLLIEIDTVSKGLLEWFFEIIEEVAGSEWFVVFVIVVFISCEVSTLEVEWTFIEEGLVERSLSSVDVLVDVKGVVSNIKISVTIDPDLEFSGISLVEIWSSP